MRTEHVCYAEAVFAEMIEKRACCVTALVSETQHHLQYQKLTHEQ